jgi:hypothetical protein
LIAFRISGSLLMVASWSLRSLSSIAGSPSTVVFAGTSFDTPERAPRMARSPMCTWSRTPHWPAITTHSPVEVLPATPTCEQIMLSGPMRQLWAICTRLSIFVPRPIEVGP